MNVLIAGESPFVEELYTLCEAAGHHTDVFLVEDFMSAIESGFDMQNMTNVEVCIEIHNEAPATKHELLMVLGDIIPLNALVLSSALAVSTTQAATSMVKPSRVVGFGMLPPIAPNGMIELAAGLQTNIIAMERANEFWRSVGQEPVTVADGPGLVRARTVCCIINEAATALHEGVANPQDIDTAMKLGTNYPHGPFEWADHLGLDTVLGVMRGLFEEWGEDRYRPSPLLKRMVLANQLGKKTGQGFYQYS